MSYSLFYKLKLQQAVVRAWQKVPVRTRIWHVWRYQRKLRTNAFVVAEKVIRVTAWGVEAANIFSKGLNLGV